MPYSESSFVTADIVIEILTKYGAKRFVALVTDNPHNMRRMRKHVLAKFPHLIEVGCALIILHMLTSKSQHSLCNALTGDVACRCMMQCFNTCMGSALGHSFAQNLIKCAQSLVTYFRAIICDVSYPAVLNAADG